MDWKFAFDQSELREIRIEKLVRIHSDWFFIDFHQTRNKKFFGLVQKQISEQQSVLQIFATNNLCWIFNLPDHARCLIIQIRSKSENFYTGRINAEWNPTLRKKIWLIKENNISVRLFLIQTKNVFELNNICSIQTKYLWVR